ncbi:hypothetical protein [Cobetia sp. 5-11-6-3]|uniref:hypothetical protein n=1 Tax=Cobetia sp. 5-11-6-3 TaxID=2737458 RepID=UPI001596BC4F|nr:hypothetical protein [Cobetia sp. 5-11-6-3]
MFTLKEKRVVKLNTLQQLSADFPNGNWIYDNCVFKNREFEIHNISGFFLLLHEMKSVFAGWIFFLKVLIDKKERYIVDGVRADYRYATSKLRAFWLLFLEMNLFDKVFFFLIAVIPAIVMLLFLLIYLPTKILYMFICSVWKKSTNKTIIGSFNFSVNERAIVIYPNKLSRYSEEYKKSIITHEHMHFIQHSYKNKFSIKIKQLSDTAMDYVFSIDESIRGYFSYILDEHEFEVRIHEMLVCYYRAYGKLPGSLSELETCYLEYILGENYDGKGNVYTSKMIYRNETHADDLRLIYMSVRPEFDEVFMSELVGVLYANLLDYYGLDWKSMVIRSEIAGPNLSAYLYQKIVFRSSMLL